MSHTGIETNKTMGRDLEVIFSERHTGSSGLDIDIAGNTHYDTVKAQ